MRFNGHVLSDTLGFEDGHTFSAFLTSQNTFFTVGDQQWSDVRYITVEWRAVNKAASIVLCHNANRLSLNK